MEQIILKTVLRYMENKDLIGDSQYGRNKGKLNLTNLVAFYDRVTALVDKGRANYIIYLDLCKTSDTVLNNILVSKFERHGCGGWTTSQIMSCLHGHTQSSGQQLNVQVESSDEWHSSGISTGSSTV
ncbi:rna-directed dna polymerase from mobile element jockey-like [Willisornis vidua]|uniref:Rna-directed dna polymerase from mobile element jockey-like n=1 Tax=Willisornis vidua TaxID=1566151 RepID=A0ABQ9DC79_9PASS|nr:rna-directed dna polymerase from mobile element jockey-like [Willisornis vidua]